MYLLICAKETSKKTKKTGYLQRVSRIGIESKEDWEWGIWAK